MFALNMGGCAVRSINNHAEAVAFYESCKIKGGHDYGDERPIRGKEGSKTMSVRIYQGAVKFRYHETDVVTWLPNDSFVVETYVSNSTCEFAGRFLPSGSHLTKTGSVLAHGDKYHPVVHTITVAADGTVTHTYDAVFCIERIDRAKAKEALAKTSYAAYRDWHKVMWPMVRGNRPTSLYLKDKKILDVLEDEDHWHDLMTSSSASTPDQIRELIYRSSDVHYAEYADTLPRDVHWSALNRWRVTVR
jgi:hypothetical protein